MKFKAICLATIVAAPVYAQAEDSPITPIQNLFDAMREHNGDKILAQFTATASLQRAQPDGSIKTTELDKFAKGISSATAYLDEHLLAFDVNQSGNLASVWTPYVFYYDEQLSHCGINSFQLVDTQNGWKIQYLIDNTHQGSCDAFIAANRQG